MVKRNYADWSYYGSKEPCPALYVELKNPKDEAHFVKDIRAALDTGSSLTAIPLEYKSKLALVPHDYIKAVWRKQIIPQVPVFRALLTANGCKPREIDIIYDPHTAHDYVLLGRNLMKYWNTFLYGPEHCFEINESQE